MDITELRNEKKKLEERIRISLAVHLIEFEDKTGIPVADVRIQLQRTDVVGIEKPKYNISKIICDLDLFT